MEDKILEQSTPLYLQIKEIVRHRIETRIYKVGEIIPTELQFQDEFHVSRITIRRAMEELEREGYIERSRGRGSVVLNHNRIQEKKTVNSLTHEMKRRGKVLGSREVKVSIEKADLEVSSGLEILYEDYVLKVERVRVIEEQPFAYAQSCFNLERELPVDKDIYEDSIYETIKKVKAISCEDTWFPKEDVISVEKAKEEIAAKLKIQEGMALLKRCSQIIDKESRVMEYSITYFLPDKYKCSVTY
ncbi:MAG: GntR family transcriptional regulator [Anaerostipes sp.]|nr:GntR family transcriptional regulator [Anaerostipes sp.]